ncbi:hypothetical protein D3C86_2058660 [compost metagenome]
MAAPAADQRQTVFIRQPQIDDGDIGQMFIEIIIGFLCIFCIIDLMAHFLKLNFQVMT